MLLNIQTLRAIAALLVVVVHLEGFGAAWGLDDRLFAPFAAGVDLFFVISGFIMVHTTAGGKTSPGLFLLNRAIRIVPLYWMLTLLVFAVALAMPGLLGTTQADGDALARSLAFIPYERVDGTMRPLLFVGWSLNLEMGFYVLFALTLVVPRAGMRVGLAVGLLSMAVVSGHLLRAHIAPELRFLSQPMVLDFAGGMLIGWLYPHLSTSRTAAKVAAACSIPALVMLVLMARWPLEGGWPVSLPPACALVIAALVAEKGGLAITWRPVLAIGDASYALYLTHPFVTQGLAIGTARAGLLAPHTAPMLMVLAVAVACICAIAVHERVERPLGRRLRHVLAPRSTMQPLRVDFSR
ncbi:acyltransferase [Novosphingobium resinovorum]|uniref:acyltransferase family protein n=1 Tax=Novosphingobium resinovorum TaxID=158500 RepID=UPI002ED238BA|nr:acyltransferase [Novosphingobium resinovorum]